MMRELWGNHGITLVKCWQQGFVRFVPAARVGSRDLYKLFRLVKAAGICTICSGSVALNFKPNLS